MLPDESVSIHQLDTPALLLDLAAVERNLSGMFDFLATTDLKLRPHVKLFRAAPELARMQLDAGAIGLTCAKLSEAEVLVDAGFTGILIANQIVGSVKVARLAQLTALADIIVAVDSFENVIELSRAAQARNVTIGILVEVNIGHDRCGVAPFEPALELVRFVQQQPGLKYRGLMGYDGHCTLKLNASQREAVSRRANQLLADTRWHIEAAGIPCEIVSGAGTFTYRFASQTAGITEVQAGSYLLMDTAFRDHGVHEFEPTLSVLATVISRPDYPGADGMVVVDTGRKSMSTELGPPEVKAPQDGVVRSLSDEHGRVVYSADEQRPLVGERVELWVRDANATINNFDRVYAMRDGLVEAIWSIPLCGRHT